jgi:hypothetical protein
LCGFSHYFVLPFVPLLQKGGVIFIFGPEMYFQTGQVIFVPEWPKGEFVSILASFCVWTKSLMRKRCCKQGFRYSEHSQKILLANSEKFKFSVSRPDDQAIPSGRHSVYCSIHGDDVSFRLDFRQTSIICSNDVLLPFRPLHCIEKVMFKLAPSGRFISTSGRLLVLERFSDSFQFPRKGRSINSPDDVVSRPDACLCKVRIAIQN